METKPDHPKVEAKLDPKATPKTTTYETREAIMACGCRIIMDAATYDAEGAHCAVHDSTEVVRVIKVPPVEIPDEPVAREKDGNGKKVAVAAAVKK
jgi:hypothetical protein